MKYFFIVLFTLILVFQEISSQDYVKEDAYTPAKGTLERQDILDAVRAEVYKMLNVEVIFVVKYLKVYNGWAWIHALPQSVDGQEHYEDILALLYSTNGKWKVIEIPCVEEENPDCITSESYYDRLRERFPELPECILPLI